MNNTSKGNYFGTYPGANGITAGVKLAEYPGGPLVKKVFLTQSTNVPHDLGHAWTSALLAYDNGAMDGFLWASYPAGAEYYGQAIPVPTPNPALVQIVDNQDPKQSGMRHFGLDGRALSPHGFMDDENPQESWVPNIRTDGATPTPSPTGSPNPADIPKWAKYALSYVDGSVIPNYWEYASSFTLCDAFFSSLIGPSAPNHLYGIAAQSGSLVNNGRMIMPPGRYSAILSFRKKLRIK